MGLETALILTAAGGLVAGTAGLISSSQQKAPEAEPMPQLNVEDETAKIAAQVKADEMKRRAARASTLLTTPQGVLGQAPVEKKFLLGE